MSRSSSHSEQLPPEFRNELDALLTTLELSEGTFSLSLAVCNSPALRDRLIEHVREQRSDIEQLDLPAGLVDVYGFVKEHAQPGLSTALFITGLEASISSRVEDNQSLRSLNASRDLWENQFPRPVIIWLPEYAARELTTEAVDFNRYLSHRFGFAGDAPVLPVVDRSVHGSTILLADQLSVEEKESRIAELRSRLSVIDEMPRQVLQSAIAWTIELSHLLAKSGDLAEAEQICRQLLTHTQLQGFEHGTALLWGQIADLLQARGKFTEALAIRYEEELPVYERLGELHAWAITNGKVADILEAQGDLDECLRIRYENELPVYDRFGDVRAKAITRARIADVLVTRRNFDAAAQIYREILPVFERLGLVAHAARTWSSIADTFEESGDLDEALRILKEQVIPVYKRLGDIREAALVHGKIAGVLQGQGHLDESVRIRREDQLPVYERLDLARDLVVGRTNLSLNLLERNATGDRNEAAELLRQAHAAAEKMGIPEADQIREIMDKEGF